MMKPALSLLALCHLSLSTAALCYADTKPYATDVHYLYLVPETGVFTDLERAALPPPPQQTERQEQIKPPQRVAIPRQLETFQKPGRCYKVDNLEYDSGIGKMRSWLTLYGAQTYARAIVSQRFDLYLTPFLHLEQAETAARRLRRIPEFAMAMIIVDASIHNGGIQLGQHDNIRAQELLSQLHQLGYSARLVPVYGRHNDPALLVRRGDQIDLQAFAERFTGHHLIPVSCL